jgi:hypothetical protein
MAFGAVFVRERVGDRRSRAPCGARLGYTIGYRTQLVRCYDGNDSVQGAGRLGPEDEGLSRLALTSARGRHPVAPAYVPRGPLPCPGHVSPFHQARPACNQDRW